MNSTPLLVTVRDAAALTTFSEYEIRKAIAKGELEAVKRGVRYAIPYDALKAWVDSLPKASGAA